MNTIHVRMKPMKLLKSALLFCIFLFAATVVFGETSVGEMTKAAQENGFQLDWEKLSNVLFVFLILSVVFETALTPVFNWRVFAKHFEGKGVKTPVTISLAFFVFWSYDLDIINILLEALQFDAAPNFGGRVLTAMLIGGGSDGIFRIFTKLGIRNPEERKIKADEERNKPGEEGPKPDAVEPSGDNA